MEGELDASGLLVPDFVARHAAVHEGKVPSTHDARALQNSVIQAMDAWLKALEALAGPDVERLSAAYELAGELPQDVQPLDRRVFDLRITWRTIQSSDTAPSE